VSTTRSQLCQLVFHYSYIRLTPGVNAIKNFFLADEKAKYFRLFVPAITFQSSLTFAGNTRSLPKKEASERCSNWVGSVLALRFKDQTGKGVQGQTLLLIGPHHQ
jgi:hypothetical protein